jgi:hypothetical protein
VPSLLLSYLIEDLKHQYTVTFDEFLNDILNLAPDWIIENASQISNIVKSQSFKKMVSKYCEPETHETSRYPPFIKLANDVMRQLGANPDSESDICFCRNDPVIVGGSRVRTGNQTWQVCAARVWRCQRECLSTTL